MNLAAPLNRLSDGFVAFAQNVREVVRGAFGLRSVLSGAIVTVSSAVVTVGRLNDTTPDGPAQGYSIITVDAHGNLWCGSAKIATGLSGNPVSMCPFRPNTSVQPWMYVWDSAPDGAVTLTTKYAINGNPATFVCGGSVKVRSDGLVYKTGIKEPQSPPLVSTGSTTVTGSVSLPATAMPWTNRSGANGDWNFGGTETASDTNPVVILTPVPGATLTLTVTGTATVNGIAGTAPSASGPTASGYPGEFILGGGASAVVLGAFTDDFGNVVAEATSLTTGYIYSVGASAVLTVPPGASQFHIGIDSKGGTFGANSGSYSLSWSLLTPAVSSVTSIVGNVTAYVWGDSPHSGPVASYIWKNPNDTGSGTSRTVSAVVQSPNGTNTPIIATNNSMIFDSPTTGISTNPVEWSTLTASGSVSGSITLFSPPLESEGYQDFNACITANIFFPEQGSYTISFTNKDQIMFGIGGSATGPQAIGPNQQTISVVSALPLMYVSTPNGEGGPVTGSITVNIPSAGIYPIEIDWDYWYHSGRTLNVQISPTPGAAAALVPPIEAGVRESVQYWVKYRSSLTGAQSNPSPPSALQLIPEIATPVQAPYSPDPQVDKCDYYRQDSALGNPTLIGTGPNDGLGGTINGIVYNTPIVDSLSDTVAASNQTMDYDDFEPVPSIDLPASGVVNISQGTITLVSGTPFNTRWLPGTIIEIGSPTQLAYTLTSRPINSTTIYIEGVPDGTNLIYNITEPILAAQPLPYVFGPTDNINYCYAVGDNLRPGTLYWSKGSNLDSWPDTNQQDVTDPSEALVNGAMSGGRGILGSIKRFWVIMANFFNDVATVTGTSGSTWTMEATHVDRGLYMPRCIAVFGGGTAVFRVKDGIHASSGGLSSQSITDEELYPLFPHEGMTPQPIVRAGVTIYPPDDTKPQLQKFSAVGQYLYYDYQGTDGTFHTLVFDTESMGWIWDASAPTATSHASDDGQSVQGVLIGCSDSTVRQMNPTGTETPTAIVQTSAIGGQGWRNCLSYTIEYSSNVPITLTASVADEGNGSYAPAPVTLPATGGQITKNFGVFGPNKWKLLQFTFSFADPTAEVFIAGAEVHMQDWGSSGAYQPVPIFTSQGGFGGQP